MTGANAVWRDWVQYTENMRYEAKSMNKKELKVKILETLGDMTEEQKKVYLKKLRWKNKDKLIDLWIENEYVRLHPSGI